MTERKGMRLDRSRTILLIIDVQERLLPVIDDHANVELNIVRLVRGTHLLGIPSVVTEQYVKGLGPTVEPVRRALEETSGYHPIEKDCFSAQGSPDFAHQLQSTGRTQVVLCGVETHVCVYQTASDLLAAGYEVSLVADAVSSRTARNREIAIRRRAGDGVRLTTTEMALFEICTRSGTDEFRAISRLVK
jgi:nicotinamidase-related amidase